MKEPKWIRDFHTGKWRLATKAEREAYMKSQKRARKTRSDKVTSVPAIVETVEAEEKYTFGKWYPSKDCPDRSDYNVLAWFEDEDGGTSIRILNREGKRWNLADDGIHGRGVQDNAVICWTPLPEMPHAIRKKLQDAELRVTLEELCKISNYVEDLNPSQVQTLDNANERLNELEALSIHSKADFEDYLAKGYEISKGE